jgi:NADH:ubiquinone oxidoreductase subunit 3 (subunit A)
MTGLVIEPRQIRVLRMIAIATLLGCVGILLAIVITPRKLLTREYADAYDDGVPTVDKPIWEFISVSTIPLYPIYPVVNQSLLT